MLELYILGLHMVGGGWQIHTFHSAAKLLAMPPTNASSLPPYHAVTSEALALTLLEAAQEQKLEPFAQGPRRLSDLAQELGQPLYRVRRWVLRLTELGILEVKQLEKRSGRSIRHYGLKHDDFFIPSELIPIEQMLEITEAGINKTMNQNLARELTEARGIGGYHIHLAAGRRNALLARAPFESWHPIAEADTVMHWRWLKLQLSHAEAKALQDELAEVLMRYTECSGPQEYMVALKMVAMRH